MVLLARIAERPVWRNHPQIAQPGTAHLASPSTSPLDGTLGRLSLTRGFAASAQR